MRMQKVRNARSDMIGFIQPVHYFSIFVRFAFHKLVSEYGLVYLHQIGVVILKSREQCIGYLRGFLGVSSIIIPLSYLYKFLTMIISDKSGLMFCLAQAMDTRRE